MLNRKIKKIILSFKKYILFFSIFAKVTNEHTNNKKPLKGQTLRKTAFFLPEKILDKDQSPKQQLEKGLHSGLYLLVN